MGLSVTFVSGLRCCGKSALVRGMIDRLWKSEPHYIRLVKSGSGKLPPKPTSKRIPQCGVASARWLEYDADRIFEVLPDALTTIHKRDRYGSVIIEADADPILRHAYPYDHRVFVMPSPETTGEVFRDPYRAAEEFQRALDDTVAFASEVFGLFGRQDQDDFEPSEERPDLTDSQMCGFLNSPLGEELATRMQLRQPYHALVESDVIIVNPGVGGTGPETASCLRRIEKLLERIGELSTRRGQLFLCDPRDQDGKTGRKLLKALRPMCRHDACP
jgi:hypothetical protein